MKFIQPRAQRAGSKVVNLTIDLTTGQTARAQIAGSLVEIMRQIRTEPASGQLKQSLLTSSAKSPAPSARDRDFLNQSRDHGSGGGNQSRDLGGGRDPGGARGATQRALLPSDGGEKKEGRRGSRERTPERTASAPGVGDAASESDG